MPGNLRKKPSKPKEDLAGRQWWRTSSALLLPLPLPLSTGSLGCIMSCILIHSEWGIGEVPMKFFLSIFNISIFQFFSSYTLYLPFASLSCRALFVWNGEKDAFLDSHDCNRHRSWDPQQSRQKPGAKIPIPIPKLFSKMNLYETEITKSLETQKSPKPKPHTLMSLFLLVSYPTLLLGAIVLIGMKYEL